MLIAVPDQRLVVTFSLKSVGTDMSSGKANRPSEEQDEQSVEVCETKHSEWSQHDWTEWRSLSTRMTPRVACHARNGQK